MARQRRERERETEGGGREEGDKREKRGTGAGGYITTRKMERLRVEVRGRIKNNQSSICQQLSESKDDVIRQIYDRSGREDRQTEVGQAGCLSPQEREK